MAFAATIVQDVRTVAGRRYYYATITTAEDGAATEYELDEIPFRFCTLIKYKATLISGTGTTINPKLGLATGWTAATQNDIGTNATTSAHIDDQSKVSFLLASGGSVFGQSQLDAGADNVVHTEIVIAEGWL